MIKLSRNALTMLLAHYRAIYKNAYVKGIAAIVAATALAGVSQVAQAATKWDDAVTSQNISAGSTFTVTSTAAASASQSPVLAGGTLTISGAAVTGVTTLDGTSGTLNIEDTDAAKASLTTTGAIGATSHGFTTNLKGLNESGASLVGGAKVTLGTVNMSGTALISAATGLTLTNTVTVAADAKATIKTAGTAAGSGTAFSGSGKIVNNGELTLTLGGAAANKVADFTKITNTATGKLTLADAAQISGEATVNGEVETGANVLVKNTLTGAADYTFTSAFAISDGANLTGGALNFSGTVTASGASTITATDGFTFDSGSTTFTESATKTLELVNGNGTAEIKKADALLGGTGTIKLSGTGSWKISAAQTGATGTIDQNSDLEISTGVTGSAAVTEAYTVEAGKKLTFSADSTGIAAKAVTINGTVVANGNASIVAGNASTGSVLTFGTDSVLTVASGKTLTLGSKGNATVAAAFTDFAGSLTLGDGTAAGKFTIDSSKTIGGTLTNTAGLTVDASSAAITVTAGAYAGAGDLVLTGGTDGATIAVDGDFNATGAITATGKSTISFGALTKLGTGITTSNAADVLTIVNTGDSEVSLTGSGVLTVSSNAGTIIYSGDYNIGSADYATYAGSGKWGFTSGTLTTSITKDAFATILETNAAKYVASSGEAARVYLKTGDTGGPSADYSGTAEVITEALFQDGSLEEVTTSSLSSTNIYVQGSGYYTDLDTFVDTADSVTFKSGDFSVKTVAVATNGVITVGDGATLALADSIETGSNGTSAAPTGSLSFAVTSGGTLKFEGAVASASADGLNDLSISAGGEVVLAGSGKEVVAKTATLTAGTLTADSEDSQLTVSGAAKADVSTFDIATGKKLTLTAGTGSTLTGSNSDAAGTLVLVGTYTLAGDTALSAGSVELGATSAAVLTASGQTVGAKKLTLTKTEVASGSAITFEGLDSSAQGLVLTSLDATGADVTFKNAYTADPLALTSTAITAVNDLTLATGSYSTTSLNNVSGDFIKAEDAALSLGGALAASGDVILAGTTTLSNNSTITAGNELTVGTVAGANKTLTLTSRTGTTEIDGVTTSGALTLATTGDTVYTIKNLGGASTTLTGTVTVSADAELDVSESLGKQSGNITVNGTLDASTAATYALGTGSTGTGTITVGNSGTIVLNGDKIGSLTAPATTGTPLTASEFALKDAASTYAKASVTLSGATSTVILTGLDDYDVSKAALDGIRDVYVSGSQGVLVLQDANLVNATGDALSLTTTTAADSAQGVTAPSTEVVADQSNTDADNKATVTLTSNTEVGSVKLREDDGTTGSGTSVDTLVLAGSNTLTLSDTSDNGNFVDQSSNTANPANVEVGANATLALNNRAEEEADIGTVVGSNADTATSHLGSGTLTVNTGSDGVLSSDIPEGSLVVASALGTSVTTGTGDAAVTTVTRVGTVEVGQGELEVKADSYVGAVKLDTDEAVLTADASLNVGGNITTSADAESQGTLDVTSTLTLDSVTTSTQGVTDDTTIGTGGISAIKGTEVNAATIAVEGENKLVEIVSQTNTAGDVIASVVSADTFDLNGNTLFIDPSLVVIKATGDTVSTSTGETAAVLNGDILLGAGSGFYLGNATANLATYAVENAAGGVTLNAITTADGSTVTPANVGYIGTALVVGDGYGLVVDGDATTLTVGAAATNIVNANPDQQIYVADGGLLVVSGDISFENEDAVAAGTGTLTLATGGASTGALLFDGTVDATPSVTASVINLDAGTVYVLKNASATLESINTSNAAGLVTASTVLDIAEKGTLTLKNVGTGSDGTNTTATTLTLSPTKNEVWGTLALNGTFTLGGNLTSNGDPVTGDTTASDYQGSLEIAGGTTTTATNGVTYFEDVTVDSGATLTINAGWVNTLEFVNDTGATTNIASGSINGNKATAGDGTVGFTNAGTVNISGANNWINSSKFALSGKTNVASAAAVTYTNNATYETADFSSETITNEGAITLAKGSNAGFKLSSAQLDSTSTSSLINKAAGGTGTLTLGAGVTVNADSANLTKATNANGALVANANSKLYVTTATLGDTYDLNNLLLGANTVNASSTLTVGGASAANTLTVYNTLSGVTTLTTTANGTVNLGTEDSPLTLNGAALLSSTGTINVNGDSTDVGAVTSKAGGTVNVKGDETIASVTTEGTGTVAFSNESESTLKGTLTTSQAGSVTLDNASLTAKNGLALTGTGSISLDNGSELTLAYADVFSALDNTSGEATVTGTGKFIADSIAANSVDDVVTIEGFTSGQVIGVDLLTDMYNKVFSTAMTRGTLKLDSNVVYDTSEVDTDKDGAVTQADLIASGVHQGTEFFKDINVTEVDTAVTGAQTWKSATLKSSADTSGLQVGSTTADGSLTLTGATASGPFVAKSTSTADSPAPADVTLGAGTHKGELHTSGSGSLNSVTMANASSELTFEGSSDSTASVSLKEITGGLGTLGAENAALTVTQGVDVDNAALVGSTVTLGDNYDFVADTAFEGANSSIKAKNVTLAGTGLASGLAVTSTSSSAGAITVTGASTGSEADPTIIASSQFTSADNVTVTGTGTRNQFTGNTLSATTAATLSTGALADNAYNTVTDNSISAKTATLTANVGTPTGATADFAVSGNTVAASGSGAAATFTVGSGYKDSNGDILSHNAISGNTVTSDEQVNYTVGANNTVSGESVTAGTQFAVSLGNDTATKNSKFVANGVSTDSKPYTSTIEGELTSGNTVEVKNSTLQLTSNTSTLEVLDESTVSSKLLDLNGGVLFIDPAYVYTEGLISGTTSNTLNGDLIVGEGSAFYVGADDSANNDIADVAALKSYLASSGYDSVAYVESPVILSAGSSLIVDDELTDDDYVATIAGADYAGNGDEVYVGAGDALVITADALGDYTAGTGYSQSAIRLNAAGDSVDVDGSVVLKDINVTNNDIIPVFTVGTSTALDDGDIEVNQYVVGNKLYAATDLNDGRVRIGYSETNANDALSRTDDSIANPIKEYASGGGTMWANSFASKAVSLSSPEEIGRSLNSAARIAVLGGATQNVQLASRSATDAIEERQGFIAKTSSSIGQVQGQDVTVWVTPLYAKQDSDGYDGGKSGDLGVDGKLWGVTLGVDGAMDNGLTIGAAFHVGSGDSDSNGSGYEATDGDFDFWGLSVYGAYSFEGFKVLGDISYTVADNDIDQKNAAGHLDTSMDSKLLTVGLQGKYDFDIDGVTITPHIGLRYHKLDVESYTVNFRGGDSFKGKSFDASYVTIPVGVGISKDILTSGGWTIKPAADFSIIPVAGDKDVTTKIVSNDITMAADSDISDDVLFRLRLGVDAQYRNFGLGFGYGYLGGSDTKSHNLSATLRYTF